MEPTMENKSNGSLIGIAVIILIVILGGIYFFMSQKAQNEVNQGINTEVENTIEENNTDQTSAIINALDSLDSELEQTNTTVDVNVDTLE